MKSIRDLALLLFLISSNYSLHGQSFCKKQVDFDLGVGIVPTFRCPGQLPFVLGNASVEYGISNEISFGAFASGFDASTTYGGKKWTVPTQYGSSPHWVAWNEVHTWKALITGFRCTYHFNKLIKLSKLDVYSGIMPGYNFVWHSYGTNNSDTQSAVFFPPDFGGFIWSVYAGCRYRFNEVAGVFGEFGYGITYFNVGLNYKLVIRKSQSK